MPSTTNRSTSKKATKKTTSVKKDTDINDVPIKENSSTKKEKSKVSVGLNDSVAVRSCVNGELLWKSPEGHKEIWNHFGETNYILVSDLFKMRNHDQRFFSENWVTIEGENAEAVMDYLQVSKYYKNFKNVDEFENIFSLPVSEIKNVVSRLAPNTKEILANRAKELMSSGMLDSYKKIEAIEDATGIDLHEDF